MSRSDLPLLRTWRLVSPLVALALVLTGMVAGALPASAGPGPQVSSTTVTTAGTNENTPLTGVQVAGFDPGAMVAVSVSTDIGTLSMTDGLGNLVLDYGNHWSGDSSISFWTLPRDANIALASLSLTTGSTAGAAHITITGRERTSDAVYSPSNGHFYSYVADGSIDWIDARDAAKGMTFMGQSGYLATTNTAELNDLVSNRIAGAANVFFGAMATNTYGQPVQRTWAWADGPLAGQPISYCTNSAHACEHTGDSDIYSSWAGDEPNNFAVWDNGTGEWVGLTNVNGSRGLWNDVPGTSSGFSGYVVEFGDEVQGSTGFDGLVTDSSTVEVVAPADAPTEVVAARGNHSASVSFVPGDDHGAPVTGYRVTASPGGATADCLTSPCTVSGLTNGTSYTFSVVALAGDRSSPASADSDAVTPATEPARPTGVVAVPGAGAATVSFTAPEEDGGSPVTSYTVTAAPGGATQQCPGSPCVVTGLDDGTSYELTVHASNDVGDSAETDPSHAVTVGTLLAPDLTAVTSTAGGLSLTFVPGEPNGGSAPTGYEASLDGHAWQPLPSSGSAPVTGTLTGLTNGQTYSVRVRVVNASGASDPSSARPGTPATRPGRPRALSVSHSGNRATLSWTAPVSDGGSPVTGYDAVARPGGASCHSTATHCTLTGLTLGVTYTFTVAATNTAEGKAGTGEGPRATSAAVPLTEKPGAPTRLVVKPGDRTLTLTFGPPASDGGSRITTYQYSDDKGRSWTKVAPGRSLRAVDGGVLNGVGYTVWVRAVNSAGAGPTSTASTRTKVWFGDPVSPAGHKREIAVPKHPKKYHGPRRHTKAEARSRNGKIAFPDTELAGRQLQRGQAVDLGGVFAFDGATLSQAGRARVKAAATSLRYVSGVTCEGYADYAGSSKRENRLARQRAKAVCALIHRYATQVTSRRTTSYGPTRPVVVGGKARDRVENRRVVVVVR